MWCSHCRQDVPGLAAGRGQIRCAQCGKQSHATPAIKDDADKSFAAKTDQSSAAAGKSSNPNDILDDWSLDDDLLQIRRLVTQHKQTAGSVPAAPNFLPLPIAMAAYGQGPVQAASQAHNEEQPARRRGSRLGWCLLSFGLIAFACGGVLLAWSLVQGRNELWTLGMPILLGGQFGLLIGLILQFDYLWQNNRQTSDELQRVDQRLHDLNHSTTLMGNTHSSAAQAFYGHLAEGANPQLLLADLKSQIDLLAVKMSRR